MTNSFISFVFINSRFSFWIEQKLSHNLKCKNGPPVRPQCLQGTPAPSYLLSIFSRFEINNCCLANSVHWKGIRLHTAALRLPHTCMWNGFSKYTKPTLCWTRRPRYWFGSELNGVPTPPRHIECISLFRKMLSYNSLLLPLLAAATAVAHALYVRR